MIPMLKAVFWIGRALEDLRRFPEPVRREIGYALFVAQSGGKHPDAKPLRGFGGAGVLEIVENFDGKAYRAVYTVKFADAVYVLHAFQKKSKQGITTPIHEMELIRERLDNAIHHHRMLTAN